MSSNKVSLLYSDLIELLKNRISLCEDTDETMRHTESILSVSYAKYDAITDRVIIELGPENVKSNTEDFFTQEEIQQFSIAECE